MRRAHSRDIVKKLLIMTLFAALPAAAATQPLSITEIQILLDRAGFSAGEIDGRGGANTRNALVAFQKAAQLDASGRLDDTTEAMLRQAGNEGPMWRTYTLTEDDVRGPFVPVPDDMMKKSELASLGYGSAREAIAEAFHVSPTLLARLNPGARFVAGEELRVPNVRHAPEESKVRAAQVEVSKNGNYVSALDAQGRLIFFAPATSGSEHDPLPLGTWTVKGVSRNPTFAYNPDLFWDAESDHTKAKLAPGPNNPVGLVWIDLDKEHYGLHGTAEPGKVGHAESHGCVRMTNWDALRLASMVEAGTPVRFVL
jgi:lipoprotein-anchoring transpeptidase ErfK/SrfK